MAKSKVHIELNQKGLRELLKSPEMKAICTEHAQAIAGRAGDGYEVSPYTGKRRVNASVFAATKEAKQDNYKNNTLLKAMR